MNPTQLKEILKDQEHFWLAKHPIIERDIFPTLKKYASRQHIIVITGLRRCGKSTLLLQMREAFPGYYCNFDDERFLHFTVDDFQMLHEVLIELYGEKDRFYFDEIQNINGWERFVRRLHDAGKKVVVTGSNATMLSSELGTHLTGRHIPITLYPFSFREFLRFRNVQYDPVLTAVQKAACRRLFEEYLYTGGIPEFLRFGDTEYLSALYQNILYRDIIARYHLPHETPLKELVHFAASNISKELSFNSLKKLLGFGSPTTIKDYFTYLENSFLIFLVNVFDYSLKKQIHSPKKAYIIDNGMASAIGFQSSRDSGRLLENLVFIEFLRRRKEVFYSRGKTECDFLVRDGRKIIEAYQVCFEMNHTTRGREIQGLLNALQQYRLKEGTILTLDQEETITREGKRIILLPTWKWLLNMIS